MLVLRWSKFENFSKNKKISRKLKKMFVLQPYALVERRNHCMTFLSTLKSPASFETLKT